MCFYYMVALIGGNELGPVAAIECLFVAFSMIAAAIINANLFGQMAFLVTVINKKSTEYQSKVDIANTAMKNIELSADIQGAIRDYFLFTQSTLDQQTELNRFFKLIAPSLKVKVQRHVFTEVLSTNKILAKVVKHN